MSETRTAANSISPCAYPGCRDGEGNARLTRDVICTPSRRHYATVIDRLVLHFVLIRTTMPQPVAPPGNQKLMRVQTREYGHPREWASDTARDIADQLSEAHDALAETVHMPGPPWQGHNETRRVALSYRFLTNWFNELCSMPGAADTALALYELDQAVRRGLGKTDPRRFLPVPCPGCELLSLVREISLGDGRDEVTCRNPDCGQRIPSDRYSWWTRTLLDEMIDGAAQHAEPV